MMLGTTNIKKNLMISYGFVQNPASLKPRTSFHCQTSLPVTPVIHWCKTSHWETCAVWIRESVAKMFILCNFHTETEYNSKLQPTRCNVSWFIYFYRRSTCFRRFFRPSSGAHNCTCSFRYCQTILLLAAIMDKMEPTVTVSPISSTIEANSSIGWQYLKLHIQLCAPDDGQRNLLKHVERL